MRPSTTAFAVAALMCVAASPAAAQGYGAGHGAPGKSFEITPFAGYRLGGEFDSVDYDDDFSELIELEVENGTALGVAFDARLAGGLFLELWASRQDSELAEGGGFFVPPDELFDVEVDYYHAGLLYQWTPGQVHPFLAASVGATRFSPDSSDLDDLTRPSFSLGGGVKVMLSEVVGLRLEGRLISTWIEEDDDDFCSDRVCYDFDETIYFYQGEARAGLIVAF